MSTEKNFTVTKSQSGNFLKERFIVKTAIGQEVPVPFSEETFRVTMFNGIAIRLVNDNLNEIIEGSLG